MKIIAIVGFGFCGRLAFYHLAKKTNKNIKIIIFDQSGADQLGSAFSRFSEHYILNVPANKMSAFSDRPLDFCIFLQNKYPKLWQEIGEFGFAPRAIYGEYLHEITIESFANAKKNGVEFKIIKTEIIKISTALELLDSSNKLYQANEIILATSLKQSELKFNFEHKNFIKKLWDKNALLFHTKNFSNEKICFVGSGLSAVDLAVALKKSNFKGEVFVVSRRGNFPKKHFNANSLDISFIEINDAKKGVLFLCLKIRKFLAQNKQYDLRHVFDSFRNISQELWQNFDVKNKKLFLRFLPYWNIFRHRAPISSIDLIDQMKNSGQLQIIKNGVKKIVEKSDKFLVEVVERKSDAISAIKECDYVVNCLGFEFNIKKYPLLWQMVLDNLLICDSFFAQSNHKKIHLLGGLNISRDFECSSVPDMKNNVEKVIERIDLR